MHLHINRQGLDAAKSYCLNMRNHCFSSLVDLRHILFDEQALWRTGQQLRRAPRQQKQKG
jgi:hypothetical protein